MPVSLQLSSSSSSVVAVVIIIIIIAVVAVVVVAVVAVVFAVAVVIVVVDLVRPSLTRDVNRVVTESPKKEGAARSKEGVKRGTEVGREPRRKGRGRESEEVRAS